MRFIRRLAQPLLAGIFVTGGLDVLANPQGRAKVAEPVVTTIANVIPFVPANPVTAVTVNAAVHVVAGTMLALDFMPRLAALTLAASLVPTTLGGHRFWEMEEGPQRKQQQAHFMKNAAILGGLLIAALD